jgi:CubicO group peptidase (beta-lactamase class C family)
VLLLALLLLPVPISGQTAKKGHRITAQELRSLLEQARKAHDIPAMAAGVVQDGNSLIEVVGVRKRGTRIVARTHDEWHLGSNTKPMTALLIALLVQAGLLDWDTPLEQIFPEESGKWSPDLKKITPAHLLTHVSGLPGNWPLGWQNIGPKDGTPAQRRAMLVKILGAIELKSKPGEKVSYSNMGYVLLGAIIDRRGKAPWEEQLETKIFRPLGITHWGLGPAGQKDAVVQPWPHREDGSPSPETSVMDNPPIMNSAGRVRIATGGYNRFLREVLHLARGEKGLLRPALAQIIFTNPYPVSPHSLSGWNGHRKPGKKLLLAHDGSNSLNYCVALVAPEENLAICVLCNQGGAGEEACHQVLKGLRK